MKITRGNLRAIIKEMQEDFVEFGDEKYSRDDLLDMISDYSCLLYTSPSPRDSCASRMPSSA